MGRILALDYGRARCGVAVTDILQISAHSLQTVDTKNIIKFIVDYCAAEPVERIIVGYPKQMSGADSDSMRYIRPFIGQLHHTLPNMPIELYDERFTSVLAHRAMIEGGMKKHDRQNKANVDRIAACIILEDYLESRKNIL